MKVGTKWKYLYRAIDSTGQTIEFMLSAKRDVSAAKRFFKKLMRAEHRRLPFTIGTDKHASYPEAFATSIKEKVLPFDCKLRRVKYLTEITREVVRAIECSCYGHKPAPTNSRDGSLLDSFDLSQHAHQLFVFVIGMRPYLA